MGYDDKTERPLRRDKPVATTFLLQSAYQNEHFTDHVNGRLGVRLALLWQRLIILIQGADFQRKSSARV